MDFTPIIPIKSSRPISNTLLEKAERLFETSVALTGGHTQSTLDAVRELLRNINSYYSNKIESEGTRPIDTERAMREEFDTDTTKRSLQILSLAHIETQKMIEQEITQEGFSPYEADFICHTHGYLYSQKGLEAFLHIDKLDEDMVPGQLRKHRVSVGDHDAPIGDELPSLMHKFGLLYKEGLHGAKSLKLIYALASHHRLTYLHPFLDGNGRTSRLVLDAAIYKAGMKGYGLWNISRGLARSGDKYKEMLAYADMPNQGVTDGTGALSANALEVFVEYMLDTAQDQVDYMSKYLQLDSMSERIEKYVKRSQYGDFDIEPLPKDSEKIFKELLLKGEFKKRTEIDDILGVSRRKSTEVTKDLLEREYLQTEGHKSPIRLKINTHLAKYIFPELQD